MLLAACLAVAACGKKGPPLAPLQRIPAAPTELSAARFDADVYARFNVPAVNVDGLGPADVARVELYAITASRPPEVRDPADLRTMSTLVGLEPVRRRLPAPPVAPALPPPLEPGVDPGAVVVMRETLTAQSAVPVPLPDSERRRSAAEAPALVGPLAILADQRLPQRYYFAVAVSPRGRYGPHSALASVALGPTSAAPSDPDVEVHETAMTIRWRAPADARGTARPEEPDVLPSHPIVRGPPPTTYEVYEVPREVAADATPTMPAPLTPEPLGALEYTQENITLGAERCFVVRAVDVVAGQRVRGPASPMACAAFADVFPPPPPGRLDAIASAGGITLIWEASETADLAGYLVLRGEAGSATLAPLTAEPIGDATFRDETARAGVRYMYAIVAVDRAGNRSVESNRVEETARQ